MSLVKARVINGDPYQMARDGVDMERMKVALQVGTAAIEAAQRLGGASGFPPMTSVLVAKKWETYRDYWHRELRPSMLIEADRAPLYLFNTSIRQFGLNPAGQLWSWKYLRSWRYRTDVTVMFPLGDIVSCWFETGLLRQELLPALHRL